MTDLLAGVKLFNACYEELLKMSKRKKTFYDVYCELWELLDKPKLKYWQRMKAKQLLNQLVRLR